MKKHGFIHEIVSNRYLYALAVPGLLFLVLFSYIPISSNVIAFKQYRLATGVWGSPWAGLKNFVFFFQGQDWLRVTGNTLYLNLLFITFTTLTALVLALFINEVTNRWFKRITQSVVFLPYFVSWVVVSMMVNTILGYNGGILNTIIVSLGGHKVNWFSDPSAWRAILTVIDVWKFAGYNSIIYLAAIVGISGEYYESARIDGATRFQEIMRITLPMIRPTIIIMVLLAVGRIFYGDFGMVYGIVGDNGVLYPTTDIIDTYTYRALRQLGNFSMSSAVSLYQSVMGLITILIFNWIVNKIEPDSSLF